jgi:hypothetical protein
MYQYLIPSYAFMSAKRPDPATCKAFVDDDLPGLPPPRCVPAGAVWALLMEVAACWG